jgi:hypothetical protein
MSAHDHTNTANLEAARRAGWPELTGSPAQTGWAITIRAERMREFEAATAEMTAAARDALRGVLLDVTTARDWIDTRSNPWQVLLFVHHTADEIAALSAS